MGAGESGSGIGMPYGSRYRTRVFVLVAVTALHVGVLGLLLTATSARKSGAPAEPLIQVTFLPLMPPPRVRAENIRPQPLSARIEAGLASPLIDSSQPSRPSSAAGRGPAVNWSAEAHRALRAFEIRRDQPPSAAQSVSISLDEWWPREHRAGDQFKTENGDWIVWINANCYQIAIWRENATALDAAPPPTLCGEKGRPPHARVDAAR